VNEVTCPSCRGVIDDVSALHCPSCHRPIVLEIRQAQEDEARQESRERLKRLGKGLLKALAALALAFALRPARARSGADGRYEIGLPMLSSAAGQGYRITLASGKRKVSYLDESALPYRERTAAQRAEALEEARQSIVLHAPLSPESEETTQDFVLLP